MSILTFGLGVTGNIGGGGDLALEVMLEEPDSIIIAEQESQNIIIEEADFDVKIVEKITTITKE